MTMTTTTDTGLPPILPPILITGADGMLGRALAAAVRQAGHGAAPLLAPGKAQLDVGDPQQLRRLQGEFAGGWIFHCAALVNVEGCAMNPELARKIIVDGTQNVIDFARATGSKIFYPQSFLTYGDCETDIPEDHVQAPLSLYGELKLEAQRLIQAQCPDSLVAIMAGFFGGEEKDKNFVGKIIPGICQAIQNGDQTFAVGDRVWQPTWTNDLARASLELMRANKTGSYQMACTGEASFFELTQEIVRHLGLDQRIDIVRTSVGAVTQNELGRRPQRAVLSCQRLGDEGHAPLNDWRVSLAAYLDQPFFNQYRIQQEAK
jgi:dTDP-4-dehydrorhamnose reductase